MQRRLRRAGRLLSVPLFLLIVAAFVPSMTPRPVNPVQHQHQDPDAAASAALRKISSEKKSAFAAVVESATRVAAEAVAQEEISQTGAEAFVSSSLHDSGASGMAFDVSINGDATTAASVESEKALSVSQAQARAVAVVRERTRLIVAGTVDGQVHALDPATGDVRWSFNTGEPLVKLYQRSPGALDEKRWLIPTLDGSMLVHTAQGLRQLPFNARKLVEQTPFLGPASTFYTGSKNSRIWGVDAQAGEVRQVLSGETADSLESDLKLLAASGSDEELIWIGRNDYTVRAFDVPTGQEHWNLTVREFVSLDGLYSPPRSDGGSGAGAGNGAGSGGSSVASGGMAPRGDGRSEATPSLVAGPDGSLRLTSTGKTANPVGSSSSNSWQRHPRGAGSGSRNRASVWNSPLPAHVVSVFQVALEEGSAKTYLPLQRLLLSQSSADGASGASGGSAGNAAAIGVLDNGQVYAVALDELRHGEGDDGGGGDASGGGRNAGGGVVSRGKKNRAGENNKVTHGGRASATQPLLPHGGGDWQKGDGDSADHGGGEGGGGGHGLSGALVQSLSQKGSHHGGPIASVHVVAPYNGAAAIWGWHAQQYIICRLVYGIRPAPYSPVDEFQCRLVC